MDKQYIKVFRHMNSLYDIYRTKDGEKKVDKKLDFDCEFFIPSKSGSTTSPYNDLIDKIPLVPVKCSGFKDYKEQVEKYKGVLNLYGTQKPENQYRRYTYYGQKTFTDLKVCYFDIETGFNGSYLDDNFNLVKGVGGFPKPEDANAPIVSIGCWYDGKQVAIGMKPLKKEISGLTYYRANSEEELIELFFKLMKLWDVDVLTGWNTNGFDFPFIVNRMKRLDMNTKLIDHLGIVEEDRYRKVDFPKSYYWTDYMDLYKNFTYVPRESYSLQAIGEAELGEGKIEYHEAGDLETLYNTNYDKFIEYNIQDVMLLVRLDQKINIMPLSVSMMYLYNINLDEVLGTTGPWGQLLYCETYTKHKILPESSSREEMGFEGGFVYANPGYYEWIVSFDFASLYPSLIRAFNYCPSTYIKEKDIPNELKALRAKYIQSDTADGILRQIKMTSEQKEEMHNLLVKYNMTLSPSGHFFSKEEEGILPYLMGKIYNDRKSAKKKMIAAEKAVKEAKSESEKEKLLRDVSTYNNQQMSLKIAINSAN